MAKIGEILISGGHLTQEGLEEALDWQVLYGGRLGTNLLELKLVEEEQLAQALGKQLGAEVAWGDIAIDPSVIGVIPKHIADQKEIVPWKLERRRLKMLCCQIDVAQFDQLASKVGRAVVPVVAPEYRIFQLLRAHYQATRQMRALDFGVVPEEGLEARRKKKEKEKGNVVEAAPELIDESAFNDIYAQVVAGRAPAAAGQPQQQWTPSRLGPRGAGATRLRSSSSRRSRRWRASPIATRSRTSSCAPPAARPPARCCCKCRAASRSAGTGWARASRTRPRWRFRSRPTPLSSWWPRRAATTWPRCRRRRPTSASSP